MAQITISGNKAQQVSSIAQQYGVSVDALISANKGLTGAGQFIGPGSKLVIPGSSTSTVREGDTRTNQSTGAQEVRTPDGSFQGSNLFRVPTGSTGPGGQIQDVFSGSEYISNPNDPRLKGVNILSLPIGTAPQGFQSEFKAINDAANDEQQKELDFLKASENNVDISESAKLTAKLFEQFEQGGPNTPSLQDEFTKQREALGVSDLETDLAGIDAEIRQLEADFSSEIETQENRLVSTKRIGRNLSAKEIEFNRKLRDLKVDRTFIAQQLDMKYSVLSTMVNLAGMDIDNAQQDYQFKFNTAINLTNMLRGIEQDQLTAEQRRSDNARANIQIVANMLKDGNLSYDELSVSAKSDLKNMELQSGLPLGFTEYISKTIEEPITSFLSAYTDENGQRVQPVATTDPNTGAFQIKNIVLGQTDEGFGPALSKDEFRVLAEQEFQQSLLPATVDSLYSEYLQAQSNLSSQEPFSATEKKKLEQAGLLNASRQEQLDHLYKEGGVIDYSGGGEEVKAIQILRGIKELPESGKELKVPRGEAGVGFIAEAIARVETKGQSNPYTAKGPRNSSGSQALGKYQILDSNVPVWSEQILGRSMTPQQFLADPKAQDAIARGKMLEYYNRWGSPDDVATAWFAGPGAVGKGSHSKDVTGTSVPDYLRRFREELQKVIG